MVLNSLLTSSKYLGSTTPSEDSLNGMEEAGERTSKSLGQCMKCRGGCGTKVAWQRQGGVGRFEGMTPDGEDD